MSNDRQNKKPTKIKQFNPLHTRASSFSSHCACECECYSCDKPVSGNHKEVNVAQGNNKQVFAFLSHSLPLTLSLSCCVPLMA